MSININPIETYVPTIYVNNSEPDLDETNLNHAEQALKRVTDAANAAILALESLDSAKIDAAKIVNNLLATDTSTVLSGPMGKALGDRLTAAENLLTRLNSEMLSMGEYPLKYGNEVIDIDTIPDGANWYITNDSTQNKPLGWTATRIIIVSFVVSNYKIQFAGEAINGKFAVRVSPGGWVEI